MTCRSFAVKSSKKHVLNPVVDWVLSETYRVTTEMAGSPLEKMVSTTACTFWAVLMPTLLYTGIHTRPKDLV
jgi:hypothetical protein